MEVSHFESIEFKNVCFTYAGSNHNSLNNISFTLKKDQNLGILGTTGSGKSTLAALLLKHYDHYQGEILLNGKDLRLYKTKDVRALFGYVSQDIFLFSDTIRNNIVFGQANESESQLIESCKRAELSKELETFELGLDTMLGERGISLSGGQKQRVALARALYKNAPLLLLDDSLSAVDTTTEARIKQNLSGATHDLTSILISHRISSIEDADWIIVLNDGKLVEQGTSSTLKANHGLFNQMLNQQQNS